ncbi:MAG: GNAT family N-acetyltransferase [Clostridia bacterium]|nr:GNAT family N-acetyltransferase [Clostridia bacterium]
MNIELISAIESDINTIWQMQVESFAELLEKYQDYETNPAAESCERIRQRFEQPFTHYYFIMADNEIVGFIRIVDKKDDSKKRISPIGILPKYRNKGYAQAAIRVVEEIHGADNWSLDTIITEQANCYLFEKMGYRKTSKTEKINDKLTLVFYEK